MSISIFIAGFNSPPSASATASVYGGVAPLNVTFSSAGSSDPDGSPITFNWNFGDGSSSSAPNPSHIYSSSAVYTARLTVSDGTNNTSTNLLISVGNGGASGLVAAYGFEEGSGASVADASGEAMLERQPSDMGHRKIRQSSKRSAVGQSFPFRTPLRLIYRLA